MTQKMLLSLEVDDAKLGAAQEKLGKLIEKLEYAERLMDKLSSFNTPRVNEPGDVIPDDLPPGAEFTFRWDVFPAEKNPPESGER